MPFILVLPPALQRQGWRVKIREKERLEPPHATVIRRSSTWRFALRECRFLDREPPAGEVPAALVRHVLAHLEELRRAWDRLYPENPVGDDR
jgi:hypothetical protein